MLSRSPEPVPDLNATPMVVQDAEWARLMRAPSVEALGEEMTPALERVRDWAAEHIKPYCATRWSLIDHMDARSVCLDDGTVIRTGEAYARKLERCHVESLIVLGFTLDDASHEQAKALWDDDRFEESYLLSTYSAAVTESLRRSYTRELSRWASSRGWSLLTPEGPGYNDWPTDDLTCLYECLAGAKDNRLRKHMRVTPEATLTPTHSMLLVLGVTHREDEMVMRQHEVNPCSRCKLTGCAVRRVPFGYQPTTTRLMIRGKES